MKMKPDDHVWKVTNVAGNRRPLHNDRDCPGLQRAIHNIIDGGVRSDWADDFPECSICTADGPHPAVTEQNWSYYRAAIEHDAETFLDD